MPRLITTPIYYINGKPSIGHAYTTILADTLARSYRLQGEETFLLTGTDENSQKNLEAATKYGKGDDVAGYLDEMAAVWRSTFEGLGISFDRFLRTTEADHLRAVELFWKRVEAKGDIYKGTYEGFYCKGCEAFITVTELTPEGLCPFHKTTPETIREENYFFRLSRYKEALLEQLNAHPEMVLPATRRNEIRQYIEHHLQDISISRSSAQAGIPVPGDETQRIYVWFDALINYLTGVGFGTDQALFERFWPAELQLVGKDILKFHCALWPAMLLSADLPLPKHVFAHGFFTVDGEKMSKSLGNVVDPIEVRDRYGNDVMRFFLMREIPLGDDGDFSLVRLEERYNSELANTIGNLLQRTITLVSTQMEGTVTGGSSALQDRFSTDTFLAHLEAFEVSDALALLVDFARSMNVYIDEQAPWKLAKNEETKPQAVAALSAIVEGLRVLSVGLLPFMPHKALEMLTRLGYSAPEPGSWGEALQIGVGGPTRVVVGEPVFPRREVQR